MVCRNYEHNILRQHQTIHYGFSSTQLLLSAVR